MDDDGGKLAGIPQIAKLKQLLQNWQIMSTLSPKDECSPGGSGGSSGGIPPAVSKRLKAVSDTGESDEDSYNSPEPPPDVPKGCVPVYVGPELRRFVIPMTYLSSPEFKILLKKAEEEFGYDMEVLTLPCEIETFKYILQAMDHDDEGKLPDVEE